MSDGMIALLARGVWEILTITFVSVFFGFVIGLPIGVSKHVPFYSVYYSTGLDNSVYQYGRKRPIGNSLWPGRCLSRHGHHHAAVLRKVLLPEALSGLINAATITLITLVGYSAMGGAVGAGGLGQIGIQYGYIGYNATVMNTVLVLLVVLVYFNTTWR